MGQRLCLGGLSWPHRAPFDYKQEGAARGASIGNPNPDGTQNHADLFSKKLSDFSPKYTGFAGTKVGQPIDFIILLHNF